MWPVLISITFTQFCITVLKFKYCQNKLLDTFEKLLKKEQSSAKNNYEPKYVMDTFYMCISTVWIGLIECQKHFATVNY